MSRPRRERVERSPFVAVVVLSALAYLPALTAAPGRMPSDSKLYLYLDPGRLLRDATGTFDPSQYGGWVPHQLVAYLWPAGPWFWVFDRLGVPDWVAHRLWIGTLMVVAGLGVRWCARMLGLGPSAALVAAVVYQLSPYVLPYVSRTSVMLLPWAGVGWIVGLTIRATRRRTWGDPAAIALVVVTVGAVNATALAMIVPAPVIWLLHAGWGRLAPWRAIGVVAARTALLSLAVSLWWIAMLVQQGRHGTDVLPYSESLADVSLTSSAPEVLRGMGYWLFYIRDPGGATTTESLRYLISSPAIMLSFALPLVAFLGLVFARWSHRRFAALLVASGTVLAVGIHPIGDRSPLMALLTGDGEGGLTLALRSSTRAIPVMTLGLAFAAGAVVEATRTARLPVTPRLRSAITASIVIMLAIANLPALWSGGFVDEALERQQEPPLAWRDAAAQLDRGDRNARVLQLPGAEFGAFRWGYSVDQPLPGLTARPLVTRDLLPLGSPGAMDLVFALDDRVQNGTLEAGSLAPVSRLLGVDTIWLANDLAFDRFRTARPEVVADIVTGDDTGLGRVTPFGDPMVNDAQISMVDERSIGDDRVGVPLPAVQLVEVPSADGVIRAKSATVVLSGSGDGIVDAAAAGLTDGSEIIRYSASLAADELASAMSAADRVIVTDSNRDRAHHWRSSQDVTGFTESGGPQQDVLRPVAADQRLPIFDQSERNQTVSVQEGPVRATATSYGQPFAYLPEHRPFMAIDGDPDTSWVVGEHGDPIGERIELALDEIPSSITVQQPARGRDGRTIAQIEVGLGNADPFTVDLDASSLRSPGQTIPLPAAVADSSGDVVLTISIDEIDTPTDFVAGAVAGVGFAEIDTGLGPTVELIRPPQDALDAVPSSVPLDLLFTRLRVEPTDRWRDDPEPSLRRTVEMRQARIFTPEIGVRLDARASDAALATIFDWPVAADSRLPGTIEHAGIAAFDRDPGTSWISAFDRGLGSIISVTGAAESIDEIEVVQPEGDFSRIIEIEVSSGGEQRTLAIEPETDESTLTVSPPLPSGDLVVTVTGVESRTTIDRRFGDEVELPVAIAEFRFDGAPAVEPFGRSVVELECVELLDIAGTTLAGTISVDESDLGMASSIDVAPCDREVQLAAGRSDITAAPSPWPITVDRVVLRSAGDGVAPDARPDVAAAVIEQDRYSRSVEVTGCVEGCWLILGEGHNAAWRAELQSVAGVQSLGSPAMVDGGFNGWRLPPSTGPITIDVTWTAQRPLDVALVASLIAALVALTLVISDRRRRMTGTSDRPPDTQVPSAVLLTLGSARVPPDRLVLIAWPILAWMLISPPWALAGLAGSLLVWRLGSARFAAAIGWMAVAVVAVAVVVVERRSAPFPDGGWPTHFAAWHGLALFGVVSLLVGSLSTDGEPSDHVADNSIT